MRRDVVVFLETFIQSVGRAWPNGLLIRSRCVTLPFFAAAPQS